MRLLISGFLIVLGSIFGVIYDQSTVVLPLQKETKACQAEKRVLDLALDKATKNIYRKRDALWEAIWEENGWRPKWAGK